MENQATVIFRKYKDGEIIALFPCIPWNDKGDMTCYVHFGQHGAADYHKVMNETVTANPSEYYDLAKELESIGYNLKIKVIRRHNRK